MGDHALTNYAPESLSSYDIIYWVPRTTQKWKENIKEQKRKSKLII